MAASELLRLIITADTQGAVKGLEQVGASADRNLRGADARIDKVAGNLKKFGAIAVTAGAVAAAGMFKAGQAASDLGEAVSQSEQVFDSAADGIVDFADGAAASMGQSKRAALEAANSFGLFFTNAGKSSDEAARMSVELTKLASDMASFKNTSPEEAVQALTSALSGETEPMKRYGVFLQDATLKQRALNMGLIETASGTLPPAIKQQAIYAEILAQTSTIQGDFERTSGGLANQQRILAAEFENAKASLGEGALPVLTSLTKVAAAAASGFVDLNESTGGAVGTFATFATGALLVGGGLSMAVGQVVSMRKNLSLLKGPLTNASGGLNAAGKATAALGFAGAVFGMVQLARQTKKLTVDVDGLSSALNKTDEATQKQLRTLTVAAAQTGQLDDLVGQLADSNVMAAERMVAFAEETGIAGDEVAGLKQIIADKRAEDVQATKDQAAYTKEINTAADATADHSSKTGDAADSIEDLQEKLEDATKAIEDNYSAMFEGTRLSIDYEAAIDDLIESLKENGTTLDVSTEKGRANQSQLLDTGDAIVGLMKKRFDETGSVQDSIDAGLLYVENLRQQLRAAGFTEAAIKTLIDQMNLTPEEIRTTVFADVAEAKRNVEDYNAEVNKAQRTVRTLFQVEQQGVGTVLAPKKPGKTAGGTKFWPGGLTWVGEDGPELLDLPPGSKVHSNAESKAMVAASTGGGGVTNVFNITTLDPAGAARAVKDALRTAGVRGVG